MHNYTPKRKTAECPNGCGTFTINKDGVMRKHNGGCAGDAPASPHLSQLSDTMKIALVYYGAPVWARIGDYRPAPPTVRTLRNRGLIHDGGLWLTKAGKDAVMALESLPGHTPEPLVEHWRAAQAFKPETTPKPASNVALPTLDALVAQIQRFAGTAPRWPVLSAERLHDIREILAVLYREAGRE